MIGGRPVPAGNASRADRQRRQTDVNLTMRGRTRRMDWRLVSADIDGQIPRVKHNEQQQRGARLSSAHAPTTSRPACHVTRRAHHDDYITQRRTGGGTRRDRNLRTPRTHNFNLDLGVSVPRSCSAISPLFTIPPLLLLPFISLLRSPNMDI